MVNTKYEVDRQNARIASAAHRVWETSEFVGLDIVEAYLNVLRQRELLEMHAPTSHVIWKLKDK